MGTVASQGRVAHSLVALSLAAGALLLAGCGSSTIGGVATPASSAPEDLSAQLATISDQTSYHVVAAKSVHVVSTTTAGGRTQTSEGDMAFHDGGVDMAMSMSGLTGASGSPVRIRFVDGITYMRGLPVQDPKKWIKFDPTADDPMSRMIGSLMQSSQRFSDPTKVLDLAQRSGHIDGAEPDSVNGQQATRYSITINTRKMLDTLPDSTFKQLAMQGAAELPPTYPMQLWIDKDELPVRFTVHLPVPVTGGDRTMRTDYSDWGEVVHITAPPPSAVASPRALPAGSIEPTR